jgi:hypothetical protein
MAEHRIQLNASQIPDPLHLEFISEDGYFQQLVAVATGANATTVVTGGADLSAAVLAVSTIANDQKADSAAAPATKGQMDDQSGGNGGRTKRQRTTGCIAGRDAAAETFAPPPDTVCANPTLSQTLLLICEVQRQGGSCMTCCKLSVSLGPHT